MASQYDLFIKDDPTRVTVGSRAGNTKLTFYDDPKDADCSFTIIVAGGETTQMKRFMNKHRAAYCAAYELLMQAKMHKFTNLYIGLDLKYYTGEIQWRHIFGNVDLVQLRWKNDGVTVKSFDQKFKNGLDQIKIRIGPRRGTSCKITPYGDHKDISFVLSKGSEVRTIIFPVQYT